MELIPLSMIVCDKDFWPRVRLDQSRVNHFASLYSEKGAEALPPILVTTGGEDGAYLLVDGWHRLKAVKKAGRVELPAEIFRGTIDQAFAEAVKRASTAAAPLKAEEGKRAVVSLLRRFPDLSDGGIADISGLCIRFIAEQRAELRAGGPGFIGQPPELPIEALVSNRASSLLEASERLQADLGAGAAEALAEAAIRLRSTEAESVLDKLEKLARDARTIVASLRRAA